MFNRARNYCVWTPNSDDGNPILGPEFRLETQELSGRQTALNLDFLTGNSEIQKLPGNPNTETGKFVVID